MNSAKDRGCSLDCKTDGEFSVYQVFVDRVNEPLRRFVSAEEAVETAIRYSTSVGAKIGTTIKVIITDGGDNCCWEWKKGEGITFPPEVAERLK